jgi:hypothetical protein
MPNFTLITVLRSEAKKIVVSIIPKAIYSSSSTSDNRKTLTETYTVSPRKLKKEVKTKINIKKLFKIIMSTGVKGVIVRDLMANYFYIYKIFFERQVSETRKKKKDSAAVNTMRTSVNVIAVFFRENPVAFRTLSRVTVTLNDSVELRDFINSDVEINYIDKAIYK